MGICKDKAEQLEKICKEQGEKIRELKAKLEDRNSKISELESKLSVESVLNSKNELTKDTLIGVNINGINKTYPIEKISEIVRAYEDIQHCKEHAGEHLHSEEHLKIIGLRGENDSLKRKVKQQQLKLDESIVAERSLCEEIEKLEAEKRENRDKMFPYESIEQMKEKIEKLNNRHQSDCIEKTQLHTALDVMTEKYQRLRDVHGL